MLIDQNGIYSPLTWQSRKIRRIVKSTIAAECLAAVEAAEMVIYLASLVTDIFQAAKNIKTIVYCDNKNLVNTVHSSTGLEDKRLIIDVSVLRDMLQQHELTEFKWIATDYQLANALTKQGASNELLTNVMNNMDLRFNFDTGVFT